MPVIIKPIRRGTTVTLRATLTDNGVRISWDTLDNIEACIYSEEQRVISGRCTCVVDGEDDTVLVCTYAADKPQYLGNQRLVVICDYQGQRSTFDKRAFKFVATTEETLVDGTTIEADTTDVHIDVQDVDSSILAGAIQAALDAAELATEAAGRSPYIGENGNWYIWSSDASDYVDSGIAATGPEGRPGRDGMDGRDGRDGQDGGILYPTFRVDAAMHLQMDTNEDTGADRFDLTNTGHLTVAI